MPLLVSCDSGGRSPTDPGGGNFSFSFESSLEGWEPNGIDLEDPSGIGELDWSIDLSREQAAGGQQSVRLHLANMNDAGKIWMERTFPVEPGQTYRVDIDFAFATQDTEVNPWTLLAGATARRPSTFAELGAREDTCCGQSGYTWLAKHATTEVAAADDRLWVHIGVWGTWETPATYYVDNVEIRITPL